MLPSVPGTSQLLVDINLPTKVEGGELKRGTGKYSHIVLIPQPSDDPCDPYVVHMCKVCNKGSQLLIDHSRPRQR